MWTKGHSGRSIRGKQKKDPVPRMWNWQKAAMVGLEVGGVPCTGRSAAKQYMNKGSGRHSKRGE